MWYCLEYFQPLFNSLYLLYLHILDFNSLLLPNTALSLGKLILFIIVYSTTEVFELESIEILLIASVLCSSDVVAAVACIKYEEQPKLFSIVFGEGVTNDAVCIILFNVVMKYTA